MSVVTSALVTGRRYARVAKLVTTVCAHAVEGAQVTSLAYAPPAVPLVAITLFARDSPAV